MPFENESPGVAVLDNKVYVSGGHNAGGVDLAMLSGDEDVIREVYGDEVSSVQKRVDCYDPASNTWSKAADLNIARMEHALVSLHGKLYAIGGRYYGDIDTVEVYDPDRDKWTVSPNKLEGSVCVNGACSVKKHILKET